MKKTLLLTVCFALLGCAGNDTNESKAVLYSTQTNKPIGIVEFTQTRAGLLVDVDLKNLPAGDHGFHIHENPDCSNITDKEGNIHYAQGAGGHYDPLNTGKHLGPNGNGHKGDLPYLTADGNGTVETQFYLKNTTASELKNKSIIVHSAGDNYSDTPEVSGGGGARIACGIIRQDKKFPAHKWAGNKG